MAEGKKLVIDFPNEKAMDQFVKWFRDKGEDNYWKNCDGKTLCNDFKYDRLEEEDLIDVF